jgi:hypothetical protein
MCIVYLWRALLGAAGLLSAVPSPVAGGVAGPDFLLISSLCCCAVAAVGGGAGRARGVGAGGPRCLGARV